MRLLHHTAFRYFLLQVPGWILLGICALGLWAWHLIPGWLAGAIVGVWVIKDIALYPVVRSAFAPSEPASGRMIGAVGTALEPIAPSGYVRVSGELWRARLADPSDPVAKDDPVRVRRVEGLTLIVVPISES